ncbi:Cys-tRNA(Pro) deacylase [Phocea massiliensis]|uniref:Cys-tRNA(Pro)/Cys-tRNA(Cys) deacylase n=1 Tax=uncultured Anaerotruncus sp. TaxID=905011 RepID=A0A6N2RGS7_9FIRM|nr:Cys-tRNA(Pro) deacylase [Merdimmobilis hominis]MCD4836579.1 Cys-tRNA(Pro) deacylase [Merdimmobilis hominis]
MAEAKTNAMRMLERAKIPYEIHTYDHSDGQIDGISVARKVGLDPDTVFKTLVTRGASREIYVFVLPVAKELDLKKAARSVGEKSIELVKIEEINKLTGYIRGGCSPVGMKKAYPTVIDASAQGFPAITVSGGRIGSQVTLSPADLAAISRATFSDVII